MYYSAYLVSVKISFLENNGFLIFTFPMAVAAAVPFLILLIFILLSGQSQALLKATFLQLYT